MLCMEGGGQGTPSIPQANNYCHHSILFCSPSPFPACKAMTIDMNAVTLKFTLCTRWWVDG